jgi:hypothetical protein
VRVQGSTGRYGAIGSVRRRPSDRTGDDIERYRQSSCNWTVTLSTEARSFITLVDPESGSSAAAQATVTINVQPNAGAQRQAVVTIADVPFTITEASAPCAFVLGGDTNVTVPAGGGIGRVTVTHTQGANCAWTAASNVTFITVAPLTGTDDGAVTFTVAVNTGLHAPGR